MRTKRAILNNITAGLLHITILLFSLIIPRLMIGTYGSKLNGLVSSTKQIVSYLQYLEMGISSALIFLLYRPLAHKEYDEVNPLITRGIKEYNKISLIYFIGVLFLSLIYPLLLSEKIGYSTVFITVFIIGVYGAFEFFSFTKYKLLLQADQRGYVLDGITIVTTILQNITSIILILLGKSLTLVVLTPLLFLPIRSVFIQKFIQKKYTMVDYKAKPTNIKFESRSDAFLSGLSNSINISLPIILVSVIISLEMASVFFVYSMVFMGLTSIISVFRSGMGAIFGNIYAKNEENTFKNSKNYFEFILYLIISVLYAVALSLIIPFINVYIGDVADINYIYPMLGLLFTIWGVIHNARIPSEIIIDSTGQWKLARKTYIIQMIILVVGLFVLGKTLGANGFLIGMIIATLFKSIFVTNIANKKILKQSNKISVLRFIRMFLVVFLVNIPFIFNLLELKIDNLLYWGLNAVVIFVWASLVTVVVNIIFDFKTTKNLVNRYILKRSKN